MSEIKKIIINGAEYALCDQSAVVFDQAQALTDTQQAQARGNIGAASADSIGDIAAALDGIIAIQEELLGIFTFTLSGVELKAIDGMTWAAWCDSDYNTAGVYYEAGYREVRDSEGDPITLDGTEPIAYLDVIGPYDYTSL